MFSRLHFVNYNPISVKQKKQGACQRRGRDNDDDDDKAFRRASQKPSVFCLLQSLHSFSQVQAKAQPRRARPKIPEFAKLRRRNENKGMVNIHVLDMVWCFCSEITERFLAQKTKELPKILVLL